MKLDFAPNQVKIGHFQFARVKFAKFDNFDPCFWSVKFIVVKYSILLQTFRWISKLFRVEWWRGRRTSKWWCFSILTINLFSEISIFASYWLCDFVWFCYFRCHLVLTFFDRDNLIRLTGVFQSLPFMI